MIKSISTKSNLFWRSFRLATWLGWQIESNWADPFLFAIYSLFKPLASAAILIVMYGVVTQGDFKSPLFAYIYLGNAFYMYVAQVMTGISWAVIDDREHYKTIKYIYTAPIHFPSYLLGRGVARFLIATISVIITILFSVFFLHIQINLPSINWLFFIITLLIGVIMLSLMGLILAGVMLLIVHHMFGIGDAVAGALYLFSGAIFPLDILPRYLRPIGYILPITYWLELLRRIMIGNVAQAFPTFQNLSNIDLLGILVALTIFFGSIANLTFRQCENKARNLGLIDTVTNY